MIATQTYVCTKRCRVIALGEGEEQDESMSVPAGQKGVVVSPITSGMVRLRLQTGTLVEMATPVFANKWRAEG